MEYRHAILAVVIVACSLVVESKTDQNVQHDVCRAQCRSNYPESLSVHRMKCLMQCKWQGEDDGSRQGPGTGIIGDVERYNAEWTTNYHNKDIDAIIAMHIEDCQFFAAGFPTQYGKKALGESYKAWYDITDFDRLELEVKNAGNLGGGAYVYAVHDMHEYHGDCFVKTMSVINIYKRESGVLKGYVDMVFEPEEEAQKFE